MSALGESPLGKLALGEQATLQAINIVFDLYEDPDTFPPFTFFVIVPEVIHLSSSPFGVVGRPPLRRTRVDVEVGGVLLECVVSLIPGHAETISLLSGTPQVGVVVPGKEFMVPALRVIPGSAKGTVGLSQYEIDALMLIISEAA